MCDWYAIQETLHLLSVPGLRESIRAGLAEPVAACAKELLNQLEDLELNAMADARAGQREIAVTLDALDAAAAKR